METETALMTIKGNMPKFILLLRCPQPPFYLAKGQIISQAIPTPVGVPVDDKTPNFYWAEVVGKDKPIMGCNLTRGTDHLHVEGLLDTGSYVTVTSEKMWPSHWELQPIAGKPQGEMAAQAKQHLVQALSVLGIPKKIKSGNGPAYKSKECLDSNQFKSSQHPPVLIRDPETWEIKGPYELVTWGHGYACVSTPSGPRWIPQKWVKPFVPKNPAPAEDDEKQAAVASKRRRYQKKEQTLPKI
ncbi:hypothetical protein DUI87_20411 [Hirundo rustica rustica]|uniref:Integrase-type domain-containing protein n=1 Tax=Hirundo rustica rustica TaxID=333673 RepID=A0A3M0K7X0_HIRRU|nr:hypothetical protein DUI87_20411 [Hirundo rustica rustica]